MNKKPIEIKDLNEYKFINNSKLNNNKDIVVFVVSKANKKLDGYDSNLYLLDLKQKSFRQLTFSNNVTDFEWIDNEHIIYNVADKKDKEKYGAYSKFVKLNINTLLTTNMFDLYMNISSLKKVDENKFAFISLVDIKKYDLNKADEKQLDQLINFNKELDDYVVTDKIPFWANGVGYLDNKFFKLFIYDTNTKQLTCLTRNNQMVNSFEVNNSYLTYITTNFEDKLDLTNAIYSYDLNTKDTTCFLKENKFSVSYANRINKNDVISIMSDNKTSGINQNHIVYKINKFDLTPTIINDVDQSFGNSTLTDVVLDEDNSIKYYQDELYYLETKDYYARLNKIDTNNQITNLISLNGVINEFNIIDKNTFIIVGLFKNNLQEMYLYQNNKLVKLTNFNKQNLVDKYVGNPRHLTLTKNGYSIDGFVIEPINKKDNKKYPAILEIHGGPKCAYSDVYFHELQLLASQGYYVIYCNPTGSDGKGDKFSDIRGKYGSIDYQDIIDFKNKVVELYKDSIDKNNIGVIGGSYGGFMVNWIIGHNHDFKCAISLRGIASWITMYASSDIGYFFGGDQCDVLPNTELFENIDATLKFSPLTYAKQVTTPTLFIHSDQDYRCYFIEALQMYSVLKMNDVDTKLAIFKNEDHNLSRNGKPKNRITRLKLIVDWFNRHLKKVEY